MKSSKFARIAVILSVCIFAFWSVPVESGLFDRVKETTKELREAGEEVIKLKKTEEELQEGGEETSTAAEGAEGTSTTAQGTEGTSTTTPGAEEGTPTAAQGTASTTVSAPRDLDIVGLKLGMTVSEVEAALKKHNSGMNISKKSSAETTRGNIIVPLGDYVESVSGNVGSEKIMVGFFSPPDSNVVLGMRRRIMFAESEMPTEENVKAAIFEKYGEPTYIDVRKKDKASYYWSYYADGKPAESRNCNTRPYLYHTGRSRKAGEGCGLALVVRIDLETKINSKRGLVRNVMSSLVDFQAGWRDKKNTDEFVKNYLDQQKKDEQNAAEERSAPSF